MSLFKITSFEDIPEDYPETLANIARVYPPPAAVIAPTKNGTGN